MRINGEWQTGLDAVRRPVVCASVRDADGAAREIVLLLDTGADHTVLDFDTYIKLGLDAAPARELELEGVGGTVGSVVIRTEFRFTRDDGGIVVFHAEVLAFTDPTALGMNVLGRDILNLFALILDSEHNTVCLIRDRHRYVIQES
jgi:predicted aspartyl protease